MFFGHFKKILVFDRKKYARSMHFCQKPTSCLLTHRDVTRGHNSRASNHYGALNHCGRAPN